MAQIYDSTAEPAIHTGKQTDEASAETETQQLTAEIKTRKFSK